MKAQFLFYLLGLFVLGLGVTLTIKAELGTGAWDALSVGLSTTFGLTVGNWAIIVGIVLIGVNSVILKKRPDVLAAITIFLVGLFIDFWLLFALINWSPEGKVSQIVVLLIGMCLIAFGIALYIQAHKFPLNPIDGFMMAIKERLHVNLMVAKTIAEVTALLFAFLFKGPIGIGTVIITLGIGSLIQLFNPLAERAMSILVKDN
ncbi:hypothetical protein Q75_13835 [Bacillus coahuilensis p1.1.43]|uniref:Permease n=1 Tax=Bacillus coahuilensis p1.1.43 TaxID=1150625 RepID=A0A147K5H4_9BACI|nr:hypothetical protein [Bacillus coahuilensis]KUP04910.1 hypothetical protein Q75_13835 [Bacillus coahuilensis p1.1.43]